MGLIRCHRCGTIENTARCYWFEQRRTQQYLCSECDPNIGVWHGEFEKRSADGWYYDKNGFIYNPEEVDIKTMEWTYNRDFKMVGKHEIKDKGKA